MLSSLRYVYSWICWTCETCASCCVASNFWFLNRTYVFCYLRDR